MNVLNLHKGPDIGAWGWRLADAFRRHTDWTLHSVYAPNNFLYMDFPVDLAWERDTIQRLWAEADLLHLHNNFATAKIFERRAKRKPAIVQFHGSAFRQNPRAHLEQMRRRQSAAIVSTLDLYLISPGELTWCPSPYNLEWLRSLST